MQMYIKNQLLIASCLYIGQISIGYDGGWTSSAIIKLQDPKQTPLREPITAIQASWIGSLLFIGLLCTSMGGHLSNTRGRKPCLIIASILAAISYLILALAFNFVMICVGRVIGGIACGTTFVTSIVYITEIASTNIRGILLAGSGVFYVFGMLLAYSVGPFVSYAVTGYIGFVLSVIFTIGSFFIPESHAYYMLKGQDKEALNTLTVLGREDDADAILSTQINEPIKISRVLREIFTVASNRKVFFITTALIIFQQLSGVTIVQLFSTTIFNLTGSSLEAHISTIIIGLTQLVATFITPVFIERSGRKALLLASTVICSICLALLGVYFYLDAINSPNTNQIQWLPVVSLVVFIASYNFGLGIIPGVLMGEMFESNVRGPGSVLIFSLGWVMGFVASTSFGYLLTALGAYITFWMYSGVCAIASLFTFIFVPETKGKSLFEIQEMLFIAAIGILANTRGRKPCFVLGGITFAITFLILAFARNLATVYTGRFNAGIPSGTIFVINLVYITEIATTSIRGVLLTGTGVSYTFGILFAYTVGPYISYASTCYVGFSLAAVFTAGSFLLPETPIYYVLIGQEDKARDVLVSLGREIDVKDILGSKINEPMGIIQAWREIFTVKSNKKAMFITSTLMVLQQLSGVMVVLFFATTIFNLTGSSLGAHISTMVVGATQFLASFITPVFIEKCGRRVLLLVSTAVCSICLVLLGVYFYLDEISHPGTSKIQWLPVMTLVIFIASYNFGFGIIPGTFTGEMFDSNVRGPGSVLIFSLSWVVGFFTLTAFSYMHTALEPYFTFWIYSVICAIATIFTFIFVPETKGKSLIEIQEMLSK